MTEIFPCFFLSCKENAKVKLIKTGHGPHSSTLVIICVIRLLFVLFYVLFLCKCVLYYCHRVTTLLQLTNISLSVSIKYPFFLPYFNETGIFSIGFSKNTQILMKICLLGAELFHADRRRDMMELTVAFRNYANTPTKVPPKFSKTAHFYSQSAPEIPVRRHAVSTGK
jgi:hypothetical protein